MRRHRDHADVSFVGFVAELVTFGLVIVAFAGLTLVAFACQS